MLRKVQVQDRLRVLRDEISARLDLTAEDVVRDSMRICSADARELVRFEVTCCRHCFGKEYRYQRTALELADARKAHEEAEVKRQKETAKKDEEYVYAEFDEQGGDGYDGRLPPNPDCQKCWGRGVGQPVLGDTRNLSPEAAALYAGVKQSKEGWEVKTRSVDAAAERLFKHFGLFERDNTQRNPLAEIPRETLKALVERLSG